MTTVITASANSKRLAGDAFAEKRRRDGERHEALQKLHLADARDAADRQPHVPSEEAEEHRAQAEIEEGRDLGARRLPRTPADSS